LSSQSKTQCISKSKTKCISRTHFCAAEYQSAVQLRRDLLQQPACILPDLQQILRAWSPIWGVFFKNTAETKPLAGRTQSFCSIPGTFKGEYRKPWAITCICCPCRLEVRPRRSCDGCQCVVAAVDYRSALSTHNHALLLNPCIIS
jgi:hypothetical protein